MKWVLINFIILGMLIGCQTTSISTRVNDVEDDLALRVDDYCVRALGTHIRDSDFCVTGKIKVKNTQHLYSIPLKDITGSPNHLDEASKIEGEIEINSIIYGKPDTHSIPFSMLLPVYGNVFASDITIEEEVEYEKTDIWACNPPQDGDTVIIIGKGQGKDAVITHSLKPASGKGMELRLENIRTIRNIEKLPQDKQRIQLDKLLTESNNMELLIYLFSCGFMEGGLERQVTIINSIFNAGKTTPERRVISYLLVSHVYAPRFLLFSVEDGPITHQAYQHYKDITPKQRAILNAIIIKTFSDIKTVDEGIAYLESLNQNGKIRGQYQGYLGSKIFKEDKGLKDSLRYILNGLSEQFKSEKDYPKWEKCLKYLLPDDTSKQSEDHK